MKKTHTIMHKRTILLLFSLLILFVSCEDDWFYEDHLVDYAWEVDLSEVADNYERLFSVFSFLRDQRGTEDVRYLLDEAPYRLDSFDWYWDKYDRELLVLEYKFDVRFIRVRHMSRHTIEGFFYKNERDLNKGKGIPVLFRSVGY